MRSHWSIGVVAAIVVAMAVATAGQAKPASQTRPAAPVEVTLTLQSEGPSLSIAHGAFVITFEI